MLGSSWRGWSIHCAHGTDIESEQSTTDNCDGGDTVDVADLVHLVVYTVLC
jgi:hypothetical protein